jgi:hypothetical protein
MDVPQGNGKMAWRSHRCSLIFAPYLRQGGVLFGSGIIGYPPDRSAVACYDSIPYDGWVLAVHNVCKSGHNMQPTVSDKGI